MGEFDNLSFDELKSQLVQAIEEQKAVEEKLKGIKKAITARLNEMETLRDSFGDGESNSGKLINLPIRSPLGSSFTVDFRAIWQFFVSYVLPILIVIAIFGFAGKFLKAKKFKGFTEQQTIERTITENNGDSGYEIG